MATDRNDDLSITSVDGALASWRQGDCVLGEQWFAHRLERSFPVTDAGRAAAGAEAELAETQVLGFVVVTQTCDIVRSCAERPFVEVCPLVKVDERRLREIQRGHRPGYGFLPLIANVDLVADLDRVMTVEKPAVARWTRTPGWGTDIEARRFAQALARKRARFAFPDDFTAFVRKLLKRLDEKHDRDSVVTSELGREVERQWPAPCEAAFECILQRSPSQLAMLIAAGDLTAADLTFAAETLGRSLDGELVRGALVPLLGHTSAVVREGAVYGLSRHLDVGVRDQLIALASCDPSPGVRTAARDALCE